MHEFALLLVGLLAGSLLTEGLVLVPFWRSLTAERFYELHVDAGPKLFQYFAPLTVAAVLAALANAIFGSGGGGSIVAAAALVLVLLIFLIFFRSINRKLVDHAYDEHELTGILGRWAQWHHARTVIVIIGFVALL